MKKILIAGLTVLLLAAAGFIFMITNSRIERTTRMDGSSEKYYFMDRLMAERNYKGGRLNGLTKIYYDSGRIKSEWMFKDGARHGTAKQYSADGNLISEETYAEGQRVSRKLYDKKGNVISG